MKGKDIFLSIFFTILISLLMFYLGTNDESYSYPLDVYEVYLDGHSIGFISSKDEFLNLVDRKQNEIKAKFKVDKVYPPEGLQIQKITTYNENIKTPEEIYNIIENTNPFTIDGYIVTIKYQDESKAPVVIHTLKKEYFEDAVYATISAFIGSESLEKYKTKTQEEITDEGTIITSIYWDEEITIKKGMLNIDSYIFNDEKSLSQFLLFGTTENPKTYQVKTGESISDVVDKNEMTVEEFLIINPTIPSENVLLNVGQVVNVNYINPLITVVYESEVVEIITTKFNTEYQTDKTLYVGESKVIQEGVNGLSRATERIQYKNGSIEHLIITKSEEIQPTVNKIIAKGSISTGGGSYTYINSGNEDWWWPTASPSKIWSPFSKYRALTKKAHNGVDIVVFGAGMGSPIYSSTDGVVIETYSGCSNVGYLGSSCGQQWGNHIKVNYNGYTVVYAHLLKNLKVNLGDTVTRGQVIGYMGSSGSSTGTHLHFGIQNPAGEYFNPCQALGC